MSGDWAWREANRIAADPTTRGSLLVPLILGSDKTCPLPRAKTNTILSTCPLATSATMSVELIETQSCYWAFLLSLKVSDVPLDI
ncbi:hypothetical protein EDB85DRAFT_2027033 [Lactarius pseudohatsudake]|nr:hypothetical protein EDB85DRAFT_2027033 [Lactarius pseudohatsudake]